MLNVTTLLGPIVLFLSIPNWPVNKPKALASREGQYQHSCEEVERSEVTYGAGRKATALVDREGLVYEIS
jgi:hypothetical protein